MRHGRITQTAWQRAVRRQLHTEEQDTLFSPSPWETCSGITWDGSDKGGADSCGCEFLWADAHVFGSSPRTGYYAVFHAAGELAARGAQIRGASVRVLMPDETEEEVLKELAAATAEACERMGIPITAFQGEVTSAVNETTVFVSGAGTRSSGPVQGGGGRKGRTQEILLCGYAGLEGTLRILDEGRKELETRFVPAFLSHAEELKQELVTPEQLLQSYGSETGITAVRQIGSGGILSALWELCEILDTGMEVDLLSIALKQETVEICEFYRMNPYLMTSAGSFLIAAEYGEAVIEILEKAGARAGRLGVTKAQNARVITSGEEVRYLDRPAPDELARWMAGRKRSE